MGKKRKEDEREVDDIPPDFAPASENKKTKTAAFHKLSLETLREKEREASRELKNLQNELVRQRAARVTAYGDNNLRNMNTKRHRAEFVLGEIKAEIERRKIKKAGNEIPNEGIVAGSAAGQAATKWDHYYQGKALTAKQREERALAEKKAVAEETKQQREIAQHHSTPQIVSSAAAANQPTPEDPWANAWAATAKASKSSGTPTMSSSFEQVEPAFMMGGSVPSAVACGGMMGMMGGMQMGGMQMGGMMDGMQMGGNQMGAMQMGGNQMGAMHMVGHQMGGMHTGAMQMGSMHMGGMLAQNAGMYMGGMMHQMPSGMPTAFQAMQQSHPDMHNNPSTGIPAAFANATANATSPPSNIPAAFRNRVA